MSIATVKLGGTDFVILPRREYERMATRAGVSKESVLPALPAPLANGNYPAVEYARASLARKLIRQRHAAGLTQRALARLSGVRHETICRLEKGKTTPDLRTVEKILAAIEAHAT